MKIRRFMLRVKNDTKKKIAEGKKRGRKKWDQVRNRKRQRMCLPVSLKNHFADEIIIYYIRYIIY